MLYIILAYISYPIVYIIGRFSPRTMGSVVVFQTAKIGDMVCTTPVFREIKRALPGVRLGVVVEPTTTPLVACNPYIDEVLVWKGAGGLFNKLSFAMMLRKKRYNGAVILMPNAANILAAFWACIPVRAAVRSNFAGLTERLLMGLNTRIEPHRPGTLAMETYLKSLRHIGVHGYGTEKEVYANPGVKFNDYVKGEGPFIGIVPGTANSLKDWGIERFAKLTRLILDGTGGGGARVVFFGSTGDLKRCGEIIKAAGGPGAAGAEKRFVNLCGRFTLTEIPAMLQGMALVIGVDTGLIYMADALNVPLIDIAGPSDMADQRPTGKSSLIIQKSGLTCLPCSHTFRTPYKCREGHRRCVEEITPEEVFGAAIELLKGPGRGGGSAEQP